jgi:hypothetical protein
MTDWQEKTLSHWDLINRLAGRRFGDRTLAEEAALAVMDGLRQDNWQRVRSYSGLSTFPTFLATLTCRLLEDFARSRFGRIQPPRWIRDLGGMWVELFRFLCLERLQLTDAVECVAERRTFEDRRSIENAAYVIRGEVVDCGRHQGLEVAFEDEEAELHGNRQQDCSEQERSLEEEERRRIFHLLFQTVMGNEVEPGDRETNCLLQLQLDLKPEEKLFLKLCFRDGMNVATAGTMLGYNRYQTHGRLRRLLARLREEFERAGLGRELLLLLRS